MLILILHKSCDVALIHLLVESVRSIVNGARTEIAADPSTPQSTSRGHVRAYKEAGITE